MAIPSRIMLGCAILVCAMNLLQRFINGYSSSWVIFAILVIASIIPLRNKKDIFKNKKITFSITFITLVIFIWHIFPAFKINNLVPLEGTGNHDYFWYIFTADWLFNHSLRELLSLNLYNPDYPLESASAALVSLPRAGSMFLLVFFSTITNTAIEKIYPVLFVLTSILFCFTAMLGFIKEVNNNWLRLSISLLVIAISPIILFILGNHNYATMLGLVFLGGSYWALHQVLFYPEKTGTAYVSGIYLGALLSTYPELMTILVPATFILLIQAVINQKKYWPNYLKSILLCGVTAIIVAPYSIIDSIKIFTVTSGAVSNGSTQDATFFSSLNPFNFLYTIITFDREFIPKKFSEIGAGIGSFILLLMFLFIPKKVFKSTIGLLISSLLVFFVMWEKDYGYGGLKAIEFISLPVATLLGAATINIIGRLTNNNNTPKYNKKNILSRIKNYFPAFIVITFIVMVTTVSIDRARKYSDYAISKHLYKDLLDLKNIKNILPEGSTLLIDSSLGKYPFMVSRWIAYILRDTPLVFAPPIAVNSYLYNLDVDYSARLAKATYVVRAKNGNNFKSKNILFQNASYEVVPIQDIPFYFGNGFYTDEGWGRWMSNEANIIVAGKCKRKLNIEVNGRFSGVSGDNAIIVSNGNDSIRYDMKEGKNTISFPITEHDRLLTIKSVAKAVSPASLGLSGDTRELSYAIGQIKLAPCQ
ncbi:hypothetical protein ACVSUK_15290 [Yersinia enterocolitica]